MDALRPDPDPSAARRRVADDAARGRSGPALAAAAVAATILCASLAYLYAPYFRDLSLYGFHDWDAHSAYRYITVLSLKRYGEAPWWHPYFCGGFPAWAYAEGATNFVSPYLVPYLLLPIGVAERVELTGTTLAALVSSYLLATRFVRSRALATLVAAVFTFNSRFVMQSAMGHTWHLQYAWVPLALFFFDRALATRRSSDTIAAALVTAFLVYAGGIYPLPHLVMMLGIYAVFAAATARSARPLRELALLGAVAIGASAPKLLPLLDLMRRYPRLVDSTEAIDLALLRAIFTEPNGTFQVPMATPQWGWHEYGIFVGWPMALLMAWAPFAPTTPRARAVKAIGVALFLLGLGAFHAWAPWTLLHELPFFRSQHVPSRFLQPAVLMLALAGVVGVERTLARLRLRGPGVEAALFVGAALVAAHLVVVSRKTTEGAFTLRAEPVTFDPEFHHLSTSPTNYTPPEWSGARLLAMMANRGMYNCYGVPEDLKRGITTLGEANHRGEAYVVDGAGSAEVAAWSPNAAVVTYTGVSPDATVVFNMNADPGWSVDGAPALARAGAVAAKVPRGGSGRLVFRYRPRLLDAGLGALGLTAIGVAAFTVGARRRARA